MNKYWKLFERGDVVELGAGVGGCGLLLGKRREEGWGKCGGGGGGRGGGEEEGSRIVITDGEPLSMEIAKKNQQLLGVGGGERGVNIDIRVMLWNENPNEVYRQLNPPSPSPSPSPPKFRFVIGTDLLYYKVDANTLISTASALLSPSSPSSSSSSSSSSSLSCIFLPAIIRSYPLRHQLSQAATKHSLKIYEISIEKFTAEKERREIVAWFNINFLILVRKGEEGEEEEEEEERGERGERRERGELERILEECEGREFEPGRHLEEEDEEALFAGVEY